jgi:hypothetical protein
MGIAGKMKLAVAITGTALFTGYLVGTTVLGQTNLNAGGRAGVGARNGREGVMVGGGGGGGVGVRVRYVSSEARPAATLGYAALRRVRGHKLGVAMGIPRESCRLGT